MFSKLFIGCAAALQLRPGQHALAEHQHEVHVHSGEHMMHMVGGCTKHKNPGAGMDTTDHLVNIYKDGYYFVECMMDKMEGDADYHNEQTREADYTSASAHANVSIVRYTDRVGREMREKMTPRVCFNFCRTVPEMVYFGLAYGRECYCTPYYHKKPGDGVCSSQCEGDASKTCGNENGMADVYEMHTCGAGDSVDEAREDVSKADQVVEFAKTVSAQGSTKLAGFDRQYDHVLDEKRKILQAVAKSLAGVVRDVDAEVENCEAQSTSLKGTLDGVADDTTVASEVLEIEEKQRGLNGCREALEAAVKALQKELGMRAIGQVMEFDGTKYLSPSTTSGPTPAPPPRPPSETFGGVVDAAVADGILTADEAGPVSDWLAAGNGFLQKDKKVNVTHAFNTAVAKKVHTDPAQIWKTKGDQIVKSGLDAGVITQEEAEGYVAEFGGCGGCQDAMIYYYYMHYDMDTSTFGYGKCDGTIASWFTYWYPPDDPKPKDPWNLGDLTEIVDGESPTRVYKVEYYYHDWDWVVPVKIQCGDGSKHGWQPDGERGTDWFWGWYYYETLTVESETGWWAQSLRLPCAC